MVCSSSTDLFKIASSTIERVRDNRLFVSESVVPRSIWEEREVEFFFFLPAFISLDQASFRHCTTILSFLIHLRILSTCIKSMFPLPFSSYNLIQPFSQHALASIVPTSILGRDPKKGECNVLPTFLLVSPYFFFFFAKKQKPCLLIRAIICRRAPLAIRSLGTVRSLQLRSTGRHLFY